MHSLSKRKDIQWLRALAISTVFIFHLIPDYCGQGYLGVDVFFVISGYLMTKILYNPKQHSFINTAVNFYSKRMKRLFPAYFVLILITIIAGKFILLDMDYGFLINDAIWSSFFVSNLPPMLEKESYFKMTSEFKFLLHTWSLSVEVQYYLIAPLLYFILHRTYRMQFVLSILFSSLFLQWTVRGTTMEFELLFCRLWQFLIGTVVFLMAKKNEAVMDSTIFSSRRYRNMFVGASLLLIFLSTMPEISTLINYKFTVRFFATILGGVIVYAGHYEQLPIPTVLDVFLTYLGDISYSFYLVHWPVIVFGRYANADSTTSGFIYIVAICIIGTVLLYEFLDKTIPSKTSLTVFLQTGTIFGIILILCLNSLLLKDNSIQEKVELPKDPGANLSIQEVIKLNQKLEAYCYRIPIKNCQSDSIISKFFPESKQFRGWSNNCGVDFNKNGTKTVILLGNSFAARFSATAVKGLTEFPDVKKMYLISRPTCTMLDSLNNIEQSKWHCKGMIGKSRAFVKEVKPDVIIYIARYNHISELKIPVKGIASLQNDSTILELKKEISEYEKYTNKIIFFECTPLILNPTIKKAGDVARVLKFNHSLASLDSFTFLRKDVENDLTPAWTRIQAGISGCKKCLAIPTLDLFCDKTKCSIVEPSGLSRYCDRIHLTEIGTDLMLPLLKSVLSEIL